MKKRAVSAALAAAVLSACTHPGGAVVPAGPVSLRSLSPILAQSSPAGKIRHVVIAIQENRTFDNLFNGFPGADSVQYGFDHTGKRVALKPVSLAAPPDPSHSRSSLILEYNGGKMNGFDLDPVSPTILGSIPPDFVYAYVPRSETGIYWRLAQQYAIADRMFSSQMAPSFPGHQYLIAGQSGRVVSDPAGGGLQTNFVWGCDSPSGATIDVLTAQGNVVNGGRPCLDYRTLGDLLDAANVSWKYYSGWTDGFDIDGQVSAYDAIRHIRYGPDWGRHVPQTLDREYQFYDDVSGGVLPSVSWITPPALCSDHAGTLDSCGPDWIGHVVNAVEQSRYASDTAIFVTWDDPGGWYDHVAPPEFSGMGYGFRVPLVVVSPYTKAGYVSHVTHDFGSILHFVEETFGLGSLGQDDATADDLADMFSFGAAPRAAPAPLSTRTSLQSIRVRLSSRPLDDDR